MYYSIPMSIPTILAFYALVEQTILVKAYVCMTLTMMSFITCVANRSILFTHPHHSGWGVVMTNDMLRTYFVIDAIYHIYKHRWKSRRDLLFHHGFILVPFFIRPFIIGNTFPIMAEIYSTGAIFKLNPIQDLKYRGFMILTVRLFIWTSLFRMSLIEGQEFVHYLFERVISTGMLVLDAYWLSLIYKKLRIPIE